MRISQSNQSKSSERKDIFSLPKQDQKQISFFQEMKETKEPQENNILNKSSFPSENNFGNGGNKIKKIRYKDMFLSRADDIINEPKEKKSFQNFNRNNESSYINSFFEEPSLIKKIQRKENLKDLNNISNRDNTNNISNFNIFNNDINKKEQLDNKDDYIEKNKKMEISPEKKLEDKKLINEYSTVLEKILKEEQILFLDDNYHISKSPICEKISEDSSNYIISKRVNFPKEIYQSFPSLNNEENNNEKNNNNFTIVYPPLNCIIFVKENILTLFNYISENTYNYLELPKPVKKILVTIPKPGMFINEIKFIMICVMEGEIHLLTLAFKNIEDDLPIIHKTDFIFSFNEKVLDIISTANHRIFISTLSNKILELNYTVKQNSYLNFFGARNTLFATSKESPSFFGLFSDIKYIFKRSIEVIYKLKIDDTRNILYAIKYSIPKTETEINLEKVIDSSIIIFDLGIDGKGFYKMLEISQEDLGDYGYEFNNNSIYNENNINESNELYQKNNIIVNITPLTRDKFKDYQLIVIKRNGNKLFLRFNTYIDDSNINNQESILSFNTSAFCRERITDRYSSVLKKIPFSNYNLNVTNNSFTINNQNILYDMINYFPFSTFCLFKQKNSMNENSEEYTLNVIEDNFSSIAKKENLKLSNQLDGLNETEQIIFKSSTDTKKIFSIIKLSDYNLEDSCNLGNLLKFSSNGFFISDNTSYIDDGLNEIISYNCMHEYARQLFYSPEEIGILFSDEFVIFKKLRPIDKLIEIIQNKNVNNNFVENIRSFSNSNEIINNSLMSRSNNRLNNPLQINRQSLMYQEFKKFANIHGYIETSVMLLNLITNTDFYYYIKNSIINPNDMNYTNNLNINDLRRYYLNPNSLIKIKNESQLMNLAKEYLFKLFKCVEDDIDFQINNYQILIQNLINVGISQQNNIMNSRFNINNSVNTSKNIITSNLFEAKNFLSYGLVLFLSRIIRLFWEEKFFLKKKLYYQNDNFEFTVVNNLNQNQIMFIKNILIKFISIINQYKMELLQNAANIETKSNKLRNYLNDIEIFIKNNSGYALNEIKKKLNKEDIRILNEHRKNMNYFISLYNFEKFSKDLDIIRGISTRALEILNLINNIYGINIAKEIQKRKRYNILNIKMKDLYKNNYPFIVNELLQIIYEFYFKEKNMEFATIKLQEIIQQSPNIININAANAIEGNFLLKFCNHYQMDDIDKIKYIKEAIEKINLNLFSVNIEKVVNYLSKFNQIENIIKLCLKKGKLLQPEVNLNIENNRDNLLFNDSNNNNRDTDQNINDINKIQEENNVTEFYKCINIILNILNYLKNSIKYNSFENYINIKYPKTKEFSYPLYIQNILSNKSMNEYLTMENVILNLIFEEQYEFIHYNVLEFLRENNMINKLQELNSPCVEKYLNNQININDNSPQSLLSMFNFYFKNKNYSSATKILASLINYENNLNNRVSLNERLNYVDRMLNTLDLQIKDAEYNQIPEQKLNEINEAKNLKEKMINLKNILNIQNEIKNYLITYINNVSKDPNNNMNQNDLNEFRDAIVILENKPQDLNSLYNSYAKNFSIFDSCISIFFQLKFSSNNNKIDTKEVKNVFCDYFCKMDERTLSTKWPSINFERFKRLFNTLIKQKTQYQNFYDMLLNNGMKNKYKDIIPLEFIIAIIESMNRKIIFNSEEFAEGDNYLMKINKNFDQAQNPFWFILYLKQQIYLPISYIFNEYYIIYLSIIKDANMKKFNISNNNRNINDNLSVNTFNSYNNNSSNIFEEYGMVFDGNLSGDLSKKMSPDNKFYCLFLLLSITKIWINRVIDFIDGNEEIIDVDNNKQNLQKDFDLKQFNLEIKKNGNQKIKLLIKEYFQELQKCNMLFSQQKLNILKNYGETIEKELRITEEKVLGYFSNFNNFVNSNNNQNRITKIKENENYGNNNLNNRFNEENNFVNLMGKFGN